MNAQTFNRGGAPVASIAVFDSWETLLVQSIRLWGEGKSGRKLLANEFRRFDGPSQQCNVLFLFDDLMNAIVSHSMRPLVRREVTCGRVGSDEAVLVNLVRTASNGHHLDAPLIATLLVGPGYAEPIAILAGQLGAKLRPTAYCEHGLHVTHLPVSAHVQ